MKCPACTTVFLKTRRVKKYAVDVSYCGQCKGLWLDEGEFGEILESEVKGLEPLKGSGQTHRACPDCCKPLRTFVYPETLVHVDRCAWCKAIWFDAKELNEIRYIHQALSKRCASMENESGGIKTRLLDLVNNTIEELIGSLR